MTIAANAKIQYESAQTLTEFTAMTDATDHLVFTAPGTPGNIWSGKAGYEPDIRPDGVVSGIDILSAGSGNDEVDVTAFTAWIGGELKEISSTTVTITRPSTQTHVINSIILTGTTVSSLNGAESTSFVTTRGAAGGPPYVPVGSIEIGQVKISFSEAPTGSGAFYPTAATTEDGQWWAGNYDYSSQNKNFIGGAEAYNSWWRFPSITVPQGAIITSSYVTFTGFTNGENGTPVSCDLYFNDEDNPTYPIDESACDALNLTSAIDWDDLDAWTDGGEYDTPELKTILQTIVDREGFDNGNAVMLVVKTTEGGALAIRSATASNWVETEKAVLNISWEVSSQASAVLLSTEIFQTPGTHQERADYPLYRRPQNLGHGVLATTVSRKNAHIEFYTALDPCHTGDLCKGVYIQYYTPTFTTIESNGFSPADQLSSQQFAQRYEKLLGYKSDTLKSASFNAEVADGITDALTALDGQMLIFKFFPNASLAPFMLTLGILRFTSAFPMAGPISTACTVIAKLPTSRFAS